MRTLGQKRAQYALDKVMGIRPELKVKFKTFSAGAPAMILQNGFGQALAFWASKQDSKPECGAMLDIIREWLCYDNDDIHNSFVRRTQAHSEFFEAISRMDQSEYLAAQKETIALLEWVKRFANADL